MSLSGLITSDTSYLSTPDKLNVEMSMGMSFYTSCPLTWGLSVPLQTVCTSNSSLSLRAFVSVRRFEAAYRLVFVRPALARESMNIIMIRKGYSVRSAQPNPCTPGLGQGHGKKRHLHAQRIVSFMYNPEAKSLGHLLNRKF